MFYDAFRLIMFTTFEILQPPKVFLKRLIGRLRVGCARLRVDMALDFQNQMFVDLLSEDGLMIAAR